MAAPGINAVEASAEDTVIEGDLVQGGLIRGNAEPGTRITLDGRDVPVDERGNFVFGFDRDHGPRAELVITKPSGRDVTRILEVLPRQWREDSITVAESKANPYLPEDLARIEEDREKKAAARAKRAPQAFWIDGFAWPAEGCISSGFGYRRIVNGTPRRYHSGVDVAAPDGMSPMDYVGTEVTAPSAGYVTLADPSMFFEGGVIFIDHGQSLESALMHLSEVSVEAGQFVEQGDLIGRVGATGRVTGPHLHWSLKWQDRLLDPSLVVDERAACTPGL
jgi:murein DD-endopeptidase MepM/ murein hydrolase activator NlpD